MDVGGGACIMPCMDQYTFKRNEKLSDVCRTLGVAVEDVIAANPGKITRDRGDGVRVFAKIEAGETINVPSSVGDPAIVVTKPYMPATPGVVIPGPAFGGSTPMTPPPQGPAYATFSDVVTQEKPTQVFAKVPILVNTLGPDGMVTPHIVLPGSALPAGSWMPKAVAGGWTIVATRSMQLGFAANGDVLFGGAWGAKEVVALGDLGILEAGKHWGPKTLAFVTVATTHDAMGSRMVPVAR